MKITDIRVESFRWPRMKPISNGLHTYTHSGIGLVFVETDQGTTGIGLGGEQGGVIGATIDYMKELLIGEDPLDGERLWHKMWVPKLTGKRGLTTRGISAIDIALWDLRGKIAGMPLYKMLGGFRGSVPTYIAGGYYEAGKGLRELQEEMIEHVEAGAKAVKMKVGGAPINEDVERVRVVRETVGSGIKVMIDANCAYRYYEAIELAHKIEKYDIAWFEEPVFPDDYKGHQLISRATHIPVATGENEYTKYGFRDLINDRCAAIIQPDAQIMGGVTEFMKVAALAQSQDLPIAPHGNQQVHVQLVAAIPNGLTVEYYRGSTDPLWGEMFEDTLMIEDGYVSPSDKPGFGITLNEKALKQYKIN